MDLISNTIEIDPYAYIGTVSDMFTGNPKLLSNDKISWLGCGNSQIFIECRVIVCIPFLFVLTICWLEGFPRQIYDTEYIAYNAILAISI